MKENDLIHGFRVKYVQELPEIKARLWRMEYEKNGADLIWIDRDDECGNKVFGIGFKTIPHDSTGIFHIIEHSVLCGSRKYPCKEPFVELIKSSLNTFLNAMTYNDKTVYPIASRNDRDFLNLTDVYLDAVFHPLSVENPLAFRQEGWHYEFDAETGKAKYNGVVYSEMKGAFASPDRRIGQTLYSRLFPDNCYGCCSGGDPDHIAELTYEQYVEGHRKYYSATNSRIFLDGRIPFEETFAKLDEYLSEFDRIDVDSDIPMQKPVCPDEYVGEYAAGEGEPLEGRALLSAGWVFTDFSEREKQLATDVLLDAVAGSNEAPMVKPVIDGGLAEDINFYLDAGIQQVSVCSDVRNCSENDRDKIWDTVYETVNSLIENGISRKELEASLNSFEFSYREGDSGTTPKGLIYGLTAFDSWLYGGDPALYLENDKYFAALRSHLGEDDRYFENLLREIFIDCPHKARVCLVPSKTLSERTLAAEAARAEAAEKSWTEEERARLVRESEELRAFQEREDTPEQLATLPVLKLSDITETLPPVRYEDTEVAGHRVIKHPRDTNGIIYGKLLFDISDLDDEELQMLNFLNLNIGDLATKEHTALEIINLRKAQLGAFYNNIYCYNDKKDKTGRTVARYATVEFSALETNADKVLTLVPEIINDTLYCDGSMLTVNLRQKVTGMERSLSTRGNSFAIIHAEASQTRVGAFYEKINGISYLRRLQKLSHDVDEKGTEELSAVLEALAKKVFDRSRLSFSVSSNVSDEWISKLFSAIPDSGKKVVPNEVLIMPKDALAIVIPADTSFACVAGNFGNERDGAMHVASQIISYDYLWNEVRVRGGAYGCGLSFQGSGRVGFYSYRDPKAARSLDTYKKASARLREIAASGESIDKFIISTLSNVDPVMTPHVEMNRDDGLALGGSGRDYPAKNRAEVLATTPEKLVEVAGIMDKALADATVCVVGSEAKIKECGDIFTAVENVK